MKRFKSLCAIMILQFMVTSSFALPWQDSPEIEQIFLDANMTGTFVVYDVSTERLIGFNQQRANTRYVPASTFKIPNSLIALATGTVKNTDEILPYGGGSHDIKTWEQDMSLRNAIKISNAPLYRGVARRIGMEKMQEHIQILQYGNMQLGNIVDRFWLDGPLEISAVEQTFFLARLAQGILAVDSEIQNSVREILLIEDGDHWKLYAKTGWYEWHVDEDTGTGWWVGWVEKDNQIYAFSLNMDGVFDQETLQSRVLVGEASLCALGLYPCD